MELTVQFRHELNDFQKRIMDEWELKTSKRIGVSIQTDQQIQDHNESHTRTEPTNSYCQHWVENQEHVKKCDRLDIELKEELNKKKNKNSIKGLACRCHKGVSNFVHKIELDDTHWYIYYGQFILTALPATKEIIESNGKDNYQAFSNNIVKTKLMQLGFAYYSPSNKTYIKENPVTAKSELLPNLPKTTKNREQKLDDITELDLFEFIEFKSFVERKFIKFVNEWHVKYPKVISNYIEAAKQPFDVLENKFSTSLQVQKDNKRTAIGNDFSDKTIKALEEIVKLFSEIKKIPNLNVDEKIIKTLDEFAELEDKGKMLTSEWVSKSATIISLLKSIQKM